MTTEHLTEAGRLKASPKTRPSGDVTPPAGGSPQVLLVFVLLWALEMLLPIAET